MVDDKLYEEALAAGDGAPDHVWRLLGTPPAWLQIDDATGTLSNTATATASVTDDDLSNNSATDDDTLLTPEADISITKDDGVTEVTAGTTVEYTLVVRNNGPDAEPAAAPAAPITRVAASARPVAASTAWTRHTPSSTSNSQRPMPR